MTWVEFRKFGGKVIKDYTRRVDVIDKAGSYAIQEHGEMSVSYTYLTLPTPILV